MKIRAKVFISFWLTAALMGCVSKAIQTDALLQENHHDSFEVPNVPYVEQSAGYCGPATLAMVMQWAERETGTASLKPSSVEEIAPMVYTPGMKGSLQTDMISASRRRGFLAVPIYGMAALLAEVKAGHPVIVFENLALSWLPQWHYAVVYGYDLGKPEVLMHSGPEEAKHWDLRKFERSWMLADYWGLVVLPPNQLAASADELANVTAAAGLEQAGKLNEAQMAYQQILKKWPQSLPAAIGSGNISFAQKNPRAAVQVLQRAAQDHVNSAVIWHNLAIAQNSARMKDQARQSARKALQMVSAEQRSQYQENLKQILN